MKRIAYGDFAGKTRDALIKRIATPKANRRHVRRSFDILIANDEKPNNKSQTLFFGIPKGTFYKKSPWAGYGAEPHEYRLIAACSRRLAFAGETRFMLNKHEANRLWRFCGLTSRCAEQAHCDAEGE